MVGRGRGRGEEEEGGGKMKGCSGVVSIQKYSRA